MCVHVSGRLIVELFCKRMFSKIHVYSFSAASYKPIVFAKNIVLLCTYQYYANQLDKTPWKRLDNMFEGWSQLLRRGVTVGT